MDSCHGYLVGSVLLVEIVQIRLVLEVVDVYLSALNHVVRLYVICELFATMSSGKFKMSIKIALL